MTPGELLKSIATKQKEASTNITINNPTACEDNEIVMKEVSPGHMVAHCAHCVDEHGCYWFPREG